MTIKNFKELEYISSVSKYFDQKEEELVERGAQGQQQAQSGAIIFLETKQIRNGTKHVAK